MRQSRFSLSDTFRVIIAQQVRNPTVNSNIVFSINTVHCGKIKRRLLEKIYKKNNIKENCFKGNTSDHEDHIIC